MRVWIVALALSIGLAGAARGEDPAPPPGDTELRWVDPWDQGESYRSLRAGEGFRTRIIGRDVAIEPRDRRSTSAFDVGAAAQFPGPEFADFLPFASFYFWRRPDEHRFLRATVGGVYNDIVGAHSIANRESAPASRADARPEASTVRDSMVSTTKEGTPFSSRAVTRIA